jgi:phosphate transport system substrate-binding protein
MSNRNQAAAAALRMAIAFAASTFMAATAAAGADVRISGTGSGTGGMRLLAAAFMQSQPDIKVEVLPALGSSGGIGALVGGRLELAVANRAPNAKEVAEAVAAARVLSTFEYARTPFVVAVHRDLGVSALSATELAALYAEGAASYPNGKRARPVLRLTDSTDTGLLKSFSPEVAVAVDLASARRGMLNANTDSDSADLLEKVPGAVAMSTLAQIESEGRPFVALTIDGKVPSTANLASGQYPYYKLLFLVSRADASPETRQFIAFLGTPQARKLLQAHGHALR